MNATIHALIGRRAVQNHATEVICASGEHLGKVVHRCETLTAKPMFVQTFDVGRRRKSHANHNIGLSAQFRLMAHRILRRAKDALIPVSAVKVHFLLRLGLEERRITHEIILDEKGVAFLLVVRERLANLQKFVRCVVIVSLIEDHAGWQKAAQHIGGRLGFGHCKGKIAFVARFEEQITQQYCLACVARS